jgi:UDP-N-acetylglucosamine 1-carboxyvinyltransferase
MPSVIEVVGGNKLLGQIEISGSKNAALAMLAASVITDKECVFHNVPRLSDTKSIIHLLELLGSEAEYNNKVVRLNHGTINSYTAPYDVVKTMRASVFVLGALVARYGVAKVSLPGGCAIGTRPVDLHIQALKQLGAKVIIEDGYIHAEAAHGLRGNKINLAFASVGATINAITAASLAKNDTVITNPAREPEIVALADMLNAMGAKISGAGTAKIHITGVTELSGGEFSIIPDRIEAGTYMIAAAITSGHLELRQTNPKHLQSFIDVLQKCGIEISTQNQDTIIVKGDNPKHYEAVDIITEPHPGFPTDLQAQYMALMSLSGGNCQIKEQIFENRFMHVAELCRMGADIKVTSPSVAEVRGVLSLKGAQVMATDLRASSSLVLAGLVARNKTTIHRVYHLDRGYFDLEAKLRQCGAEVKRINQQ